MRYKNVKCLCKYLLIIFIMGFTFNNNVNAELCDNEHIRELKALAKKIDINYEYIDNSDIENASDNDEFMINEYSVTVNLISDELYFGVDDVDYYYNNYENGIVNFSSPAGNLNLIIRSKKCAGYKIDTISIKLPHFNTYSYRDECKMLEEYNLDVCSPWYQGSINDSVFNSAVNKYLKDDEVLEVSFFDKLISFLKKYVIYISGSILIFILIIIFVINNRERSVLK